MIREDLEQILITPTVRL